MSKKCFKNQSDVEAHFDLSRSLDARGQYLNILPIMENIQPNVTSAKTFTSRRYTVAIIQYERLQFLALELVFLLLKNMIAQVSRVFKSNLNQIVVSLRIPLKLQRGDINYKEIITNSRKINRIFDDYYFYMYSFKKRRQSLVFFDLRKIGNEGLRLPENYKTFKTYKKSLNLHINQSDYKKIRKTLYCKNILNTQKASYSKKID